MGARAEYSLDGEGFPLPQTLVAEGPLNVQSDLQIFLTFLASFSAGNHGAAGRFPS
jgi:hypothetical protein